MARSCGIHLGRRRFDLVVLDGSAKKPKVVHQASGEVEPGDDPVAATAAALKEAIRGHKVPTENVGLAVDGGLAAFRHLSLPFDDRSKIEEVVKFEVEGKLPHWDIDDVVVDFLYLQRTPGVASTLLVLAAPKDRLAARIRSCERAGLEPYEAELDTTALFNAAEAAGLLGEDAAQVLVLVGDASTSVVVADGGKLHAMRAIQAGSAGAGTGSDEDEPAPEPAEGEEAAPAALPVEGDLERRRAATARRLRRELGRTISGATTDHPIEAVYVAGPPLPGLDDEPIQGVPVRRFDRVGEDDLGGGARAAAFGAALRRLGGGSLVSALRREELRYTGKFERLELPLAVAALLLLTTVVVHFIVVDKRARAHENALLTWLTSSNLWMLPDLEKDHPGRLTQPPAGIESFARRAQAGEVDVPVDRRLDEIERQLALEIGRLRRELGQVSEVPQPQSAFEALTLVLAAIDRLDQEVDGRIAIRSVRSDTAQTRLNQDGKVVVKLDLDFLSDEGDVAATSHYNRLVNALETEPWVLKFDRKPTKVLDNGKGISVDGVAVEVDVERAPEEPA